MYVMKKYLMSLGILSLIIIVIFVGGVYGTEKILENYNSCRLNAYERSGSEVINVVLETCGVGNMNELTEEDQTSCKTEAVNSAKMAEVKAKEEIELAECEMLAEEQSSNPFIKYPVTILRSLGV